MSGYCHDCPDHEACSTGYPCEVVKRIAAGQPYCPRCGGRNGVHGLVHVRHGNGGGHNTPCPLAATP